MSRAGTFQEIYDLLYKEFGPQHWWPGETPFEIVVGAVLTQNTNWVNVKKAIGNLKMRGWLTFEALVHAPAEEVAQCIRPSGYYNLKTGRLQNLLQMIVQRYDGRLEDMLADRLDTARENLLSVKGIGPETADSILLYGGSHPVFVVDAYTHRIFSRHNLIGEECGYQEMQEEFMSNLPAEWQLYNEYHALIVKLGKEYCKKTTPLCEQCPLQWVNL